MYLRALKGAVWNNLLTSVVERAKGGYSIILMELAEAITNITASKRAMAAISSRRFDRSPLIIKPLTASTP
uniref:Uncharacterized protein n=1 Tax=Candidatus Methanosuratincola petrocarbonis (ex Vanwonterghem et al. 2016) TaxID=1867261 RepID=A0A7J3UZW4_9CREN